MNYKKILDELEIVIESMDIDKKYKKKLYLKITDSLYNDSINKKVLTEIETERARQDSKWGIQNHEPLKWNAILGEEFGEVSKAILENDTENYREELIQVAAVAIAAVESLDRQKR